MRECENAREERREKREERREKTEDRRQKTEDRSDEVENEDDNEREMDDINNAGREAVAIAIQTGRCYAARHRSPHYYYLIVSHPTRHYPIVIDIEYVPFSLDNNRPTTARGDPSPDAQKSLNPIRCVMPALPHESLRFFCVIPARKCRTR